MNSDLTRRGLLEATAGAGISSLGVSLLPPLAFAQSLDEGPPTDTELSLNINGTLRTATVDIRSTLLDTLRERLGLTGTKKGCDRGECGACTVHIDGRRVLSCMTLAVLAEGREITTIEGIADGDQLHPVQAAFIEHDAFQCGFCTSGQIMSAIALIREGNAGSAEDIREYMSGNICRCSAYPQIRAAVAAVGEA